ncbi:MAG TPA: Ig-like domain repeat protein [Candidatus Sulfotelmatobacter sp.]|nr:Ig-like domain repeat protein [Candidatus Sulfotelmatobacter sp.]
MKFLATNLRLMALAALVLLGLGLAAQNSLAQTVSASPVNLSYGVPTGTPATGNPPAPASADESVTVTISGASLGSPVTFGATTVGASSPALGTDNPADFVIDGNSCTGTFTAPTTCQVSLHYNASLAPATTLETALLTISSNVGFPTVPLSGAYGSIKLFNETNVTSTDANNNKLPNPYTIASNTLNLSCPASPTASLSNTPDGLGNVLVDSYVLLSINGTAVNGTSVGSLNYPPGNVCTDGPAPNYGGNYYSNCNTTNYEDQLVFEFNSLNGLDPDTFANPGNAILHQLGENPNNAGGLPPINLGTFFFQTSTPPLQALFTLQEYGSVAYDNSTLFLATNCSPAGIVPGGSITGNPTPTNTFAFDSNPNQNVSIVDSTALAPPPTGTVPIVTDIAVPQQLFDQLVAGTSSAPDVCFRLSGELDYSVTPPAPMCKGFLVQCYNPANGTTSGANCDPSSPNGLRNLYESLQFASPDAPVNGTNFLYNASPNACSYYLGNVSGAACANGTGPGLLMGGDNWLCAPGSQNATTCTSLEPSPATFNTTTPPGTPIYSEANCVLTGGLAGDLCPLDILTQIQGAADNQPGGSAPLKNSVFLPVANHPLPTATLTIPTASTPITNQNPGGWVNNSTINAAFNSYAAAYSPGGTNPPANGFLAAPPYSLTYGLSSASAPLPDTTYPLATDATNYNSGVSHSLASPPICPSSGTPASFASAGSFNSLNNGIYYLHYFTTDCALTEGLVFNPQGPQLTDPTANWASFPFVTVGVDTVAPTLTSCTPPAPVYGNWYGGPSGNITVQCTVTDQNWVAGVTGSGFGMPPSAGIQGSQTENVSVFTNVANNTYNTAATAGAMTNPAGTVPPPLQVSDLAGNPVAGGVSAGPYPVDLQAPVITGPTLSSASTMFNGPAINVSFSCNDGSGSGTKLCTASGPNFVLTGCSPYGTEPVNCTGTISSSPLLASGTITVTAVDNVGNQGMASSSTYSVTAAATTTTISAPTVTYPANGIVTVTVSSTGGTPSGNVTLSVDGGTPLMAALNGSGMATFTLSGLSATTHTLSASYAAQGNFAASGPTAGALTVNAAATKTSISAPTVTYPANGIVTVTVSSTAGTPTGNVTLSVDGGTPLAAALNGSGMATFTLTSLSATTHTLSASYAAQGNFAASSANGTITVNPPPTLTISPSSWNFGPLYQGQGARQTFTISNPGSASISISSINIPGSNNDGSNQPPGDPDDFQIVYSTCGKSLAGGANCHVTVHFQSDSDDPVLPNPGSYAYLTVTDNAPSSPQTAYMSVRVINPRASLSTSYLQFGKQPTGKTTSPLKVTVFNSGTGVVPLTFNTISIGGSIFALGSGTTCVNGGMLAPGSSCLIYVTFTPAMKGTYYTGSVVITDNAMNSPQKISLSGTGD